ncbi:MAG TPA: hypothetical protein VFJ09_05640 [Nocardioidaceae bacterium]|nr:hypothetical protein [Nocardioidaceae bacterium]
MNELEQRLADDLNAAATLADVPPAPVTELATAGRRQVRRHRIVTACATAAAVLVVLTGVGLGATALRADHPARPIAPGPTPSHHVRHPQRQNPSGLEDLPTGAPPAVYWHAGVLHVGDISIPTALDQIVTAGGKVLVGHARGADPSQWDLVDGDHLVPVVQTPQAIFIRLSPDGRLAVWEVIHPQVTRVVAWDVASQRVAGYRDINIEQPSCCGGGPSLMLYGADSRGQVFYGDGRTLTVWTPSTGTVRTVTGYGQLPALPSAVTPFGLVFQGDGPGLFDMPGVYGTVDADGVFHRQGRTPIDSGVWSPDGRLFAYPADGSGAVDNKNPRLTVYVYDTSTGQRQQLLLPLGAGVPEAWESPDTLLISGGQPGGLDQVIRCDTTTRTCQIAIRYPHPRGWSFGWF